MFCLNCDDWIGEKSGVCANCATIDLAQNDFRYEGTTANLNVPQSLITQISPLPVSVQTRIIEKPKKSKFFLGFSLATILFLIIGFGSAALAVVLIDWKQVGKMINPPQTSQTQQTNNIERTPEKTPETKETPQETIQETQIIENQIRYNDSFHVTAASFTHFRIPINENNTLRGEFSAKGGNDDIRCWIVDEDNFINFKKGNAFSNYFDSDYRTIGKFNVVLPTGIYYIIFDNRKASFTNKTVTANFETE